MRIYTAIFFIALLGLTACASQPRSLDFAPDASQAAKIEIPNNIKPLTLDGKKIKLPLALTYPYLIKVPSGPRQFTFRYEQEWGQGAQSEYRDSQIMQVEFDAQANEKYRIEFVRPKPPLFLESANRYIDSFAASFVSSSGEKIDAKGVGLGRNSLSALLGLGANDNTSNDMATAYGDAPTFSDNGKESSPRLIEMQKLWQTASEDEKKAFMNWVISPDK